MLRFAKIILLILLLAGLAACDMDTPQPQANDIWVCGMEITQVIQNYPYSSSSDMIPLISYKSTIVRVYIASTNGPWNNITASLLVHNIDNSGPFPVDDNVLTPSNLRGVITAPSACSDRGQLTDSFYFVLPWYDTVPTLESGRNFQVTIDSSRSGSRESDETNNIYSQTVIFGPHRSVTVHGVTYSNTNPDLGPAPWADFEPQRKYVQAALPVDNFFIMPLPGNPHPAFDNTIGEAYLTARDWAARMEAETLAQGQGYTPIYLLQPENSRLAGAASRRRVQVGESTYDVVVLNGQDIPANPQVMAQEISHWLGLWWHAVSPAYPADDANADFPFSDATIGPQVGVNLQNPTDPVLRGSGVYDIMSYAPYSTNWFSPYSYCQLIGNIYNDSISCPTSVRRVKENGNLVLAAFHQPGVETNIQDAIQENEAHSLFISGWINPDGTANFTQFQIISSKEKMTSTSNGKAYRLTLEGIDGQILQELDFDPGASMHPESGESLYFAILLPYNLETTRIVLYNAEKELATRAVSAHAPEVSLDHFSSSDYLSGDQTITWQATDADNDLLTFTLEYSTDGGQGWIPLNTLLTGTSTQVDFDSLPGTEEGMLRLFASDGVNTTETQSTEKFRVAAKPPEINLISPKDGTIFYSGQPFILEATAFDWNDGALTDPATYSWSSDLDGEIAQSPWTILSNLSPGKHTMTLSVKNSLGMISTASIQITILDETWIPQK